MESDRPAAKGMDAMGSGRTYRLSQLWQLPLLVFSIGLFVYAAYLFIDPQAGPTIGQKIDYVRRLLEQDRSEAAIEQLNLLLTKEKLTNLQEGAVRMMLAKGIDLTQKRNRLSIASNEQQIVEQTRMAIALGIEADAETLQRLAESLESLGKYGESVTHYRKLAVLDPPHVLKWERKVIDLQLAQEEHTAAASSLEAFLKHADISGTERAWALGEMAHVKVDLKEYKEAGALLAEAVKIDGQEPAGQGQFHYWLGYCAWKLNDPEGAEKHLRVARDLLKVQHPLDADAAYVLGKILQDRRDWQAAKSFYSGVMQDHLDSRVMPLARLGRGVCRIATGSEEAGIADLQDIVKYVTDRQGGPARVKEEALGALRDGAQLLSAAGKVDGALELMAYEQELNSKPAPEFFGRLAKLYERHADQIDASLLEAKTPARPALEQKAREARSKSGDAYVALSRGLTLKDDKGYGQALWKGIEMYDAAADLPRTILALETFVAERPSDSLAPDALLRLGQAYHAAGMFDKAIFAYRKNQIRYPNSLAASKSGVPLARAYLAKGPDFYRAAEDVLKSVVESNVQITPDAQEFREALSELAGLYYRTGRYEQSVSRLEELTQRYPQDERLGQFLFLMADSYRKSALALDEKVAAAKARSDSKAPSTQPAIDVVEARQARSDRLGKARDLYSNVIEHFRKTGPVRDLDKLYLKLAFFHRADCVYELRDYPEAIQLYGDAAFRYQDDPSALAAYVQIVNANVALGKLDEAKAANERAKWMLRRMPPESFSDTAGSYGMSKPYWEEWLKWSSESGMWK